jgi:hypothetical protein
LVTVAVATAWALQPGRAVQAALWQRQDLLLVPGALAVPAGLVVLTLASQSLARAHAAAAVVAAAVAVAVAAAAALLAVWAQPAAQRILTA